MSLSVASPGPHCHISLLLQLLLRPSPVITTYQPLGATSTPAGKRLRDLHAGANSLGPCQSSPLRKEPDTNKVSSEPKHITRVEDVSSFTWIGSVYEQMSTCQQWVLVIVGAKCWEVFKPTFWKEIVPSIKWWTAETTKPNNSPPGFLVGPPARLLLLSSFLFPPLAVIGADPSPGPYRGSWFKALFSISHRLHVWANRIWPHRRETYLKLHRSFLLRKLMKRKVTRQTQTVLILFIFVAAQSTGNVCARC